MLIYLPTTHLKSSLLNFGHTNRRGRHYNSKSLGALTARANGKLRRAPLEELIGRDCGNCSTGRPSPRGARASQDVYRYVSAGLAGNSWSCVCSVREFSATVNPAYLSRVPFRTRGEREGKIFFVKCRWWLRFVCLWA